MKGIEKEPVPSPVVLSSVITRHGPFEHMTIAVTAAKHFYILAPGARGGYEGNIVIVLLLDL